MAVTKQAPEKLITDNIDIWTSAIKKRGSQGRGSNKKITLYGIKKLRELILELAVRGLLVPQDPSDEPASVLLENIAAEKELLLKEGKIKKQKALAEISDDEKLFELPSGWRWVRFQDVSEYIQRGKGPQYADVGEVRVVSQKCVQASGFILDPAKYVEDSSLDKYQQERFLKNNDLLWNSTGTGTVGRINIITDITPKTLVADSHVTVIRTLLVNTGFIWSYISAPGVQSRIEPAHENALVSGSTKQVELNTSSVINLLVPIPPEAEQPRIVAKVNELMALCDQLEQQTESSLTAHQTLVETLLNTLLTAAQTSTHSSAGIAKQDKPDKANPKTTVAKESGLTAKNTQSTRVARGAGFAGNEGALVSNSGENSSSSSFESAWNRIAQHFDVLFTTEHSIDQLKQTILQLAVMGKLVPQDPNDEPASVLLEKITKEKEQLIKDKTIKKQKLLSPISDDEKPFELPSGWEWARLGQLGYDMGGGTPSKGRSDYWDGPISWVSPKDMKVDFIEASIDSISELAIQETTVNLVPVNSLLVVVRGMILAHSFPVAINKRAVAINQDMKALVFSDLDKEFLLLLMKGFKLEFLKLVERSSHGTCKLNSEQLWAKVIAVPPKTEQLNIAARVNEFMALCSALKSRISESQATQLYLADAMAEQALK